MVSCEAFPIDSLLLVVPTTRQTKLDSYLTGQSSTAARHTFQSDRLL